MKKKKLLIREIFGPQNFLAIQYQLSKCNFVPSIMLCGNNFQRNIFPNPPMQIKLHNFHEKKNFITRIGFGNKINNVLWRLWLKGANAIFIILGCSCEFK